MLRDIRAIASRLEFIGSGLEIEDPNPRGAALAVVDTEMKVLDLVEDLERMTASARDLAGTKAEACGGEVPHA
ncbi:MAG: hypothetical protein ACP59X_04415 [Solidesulfovibrio sp. DCME]|uniref:hypothetical protein n=1 Tax=Solidesulfovibrio sp. DCME TaxID=3447380 RepID=UPI003D0EAFCC